VFNLSFTSSGLTVPPPAPYAPLLPASAPSRVRSTAAPAAAPQLQLARAWRDAVASRYSCLSPNTTLLLIEPRGLRAGSRRLPHRRPTLAPCVAPAAWPRPARASAARRGARLPPAEEVTSGLATCQVLDGQSAGSSSDSAAEATRALWAICAVQRRARPGCPAQRAPPGAPELRRACGSLHDRLRTSPATARSVTSFGRRSSSRWCAPARTRAPPWRAAGPPLLFWHRAAAGAARALARAARTRVRPVCHPTFLFAAGGSH
jgi:hypothetical protein